MTDSLVGIELDNGGILLKFLQTGAETGGALHVQQARYASHSAPPPYHRHPRQDERFIILEGELQFLVDGLERRVRAGEAIDVPKGAFHRAHNPGDVPALVTWETRPALRSAEFFVDMHRAAAGRARPGLADAAAILMEYRDVFELAKPPPLVQRVVLGCLAPFGRRAVGAYRARQTLRDPTNKARRPSRCPPCSGQLHEPTSRAFLRAQRFHFAVALRRVGHERVDQRSRA